MTGDDQAVRVVRVLSHGQKFYVEKIVITINTAPPSSNHKLLGVISINKRSNLLLAINRILYLYFCNMDKYASITSNYYSSLIPVKRKKNKMNKKNEIEHDNDVACEYIHMIH